MLLSGSHWVDVRDKPGFLHRMMSELAGGACMSLEGTLAKCSFSDQHVVTREEAGVLKHITLSPRLDFVVLKLEPATVAPLFREIAAAGLTRDIIHLQIQRNETLQLGAYDNFHRECVVTGPEVSAALLGALKASGVVRSFAAVFESGV